MKKQYIFIIILYLIGSSVAYSQTSRPRRVEVGIIAGPAIDWAVPNTKGYSSTGAKIGGIYGVNVDINLAPTSSNYFFSTGINARHIRYGLEYKDHYQYINPETYETEIFNNAIVKSTFNSTYVTIPTAIKLKTNPFGSFTFWGLVGVEHAFAVSSKSNDEIKLEDGSSKKQDKVEHYKHTAVFKESLYVVFGAEYIIQDNTKISLGLGYNYGFNNMFRKKYKNSVSEFPVKAHTHCIEIQVGVLF